MTSPPFPPPTSNFSPFTGPPPLIGHQPPPSMGAPYPPPILYWPYPSPPISPPHQPPALLIMQGTPPPMAPPPPVDMCNLIHSMSEVYTALRLLYYILYRVFPTDVHDYDINAYWEYRGIWRRPPDMDIVFVFSRPVGSSVKVS